MLTERQRAEAIAACDRILDSQVRLVEIAADIKRGAEELRNLYPYHNPARMPKDGDSAEGDLTGEV